jgi:putative oxidoreductase
MGGSMMEATRPRRLIPVLEPLYDRMSDYAYPLIRFATGMIFMPHGAQKLFGLWGGSIAGTAAAFSKLGIEPALPLTWYIALLEFFGGLALAAGLLTRPLAVLFAGFMAVATFQVHMGNGFFWTKGGFEYPLLLLILSIAIAIRGGGKLSLDRRIGAEL